MSVETQVQDPHRARERNESEIRADLMRKFWAQAEWVRPASKRLHESLDWLCSDAKENSSNEELEVLANGGNSFGHILHVAVFVERHVKPLFDAVIVPQTVRKPSDVREVLNYMLMEFRGISQRRLSKFLQTYQPKLPSPNGSGCRVVVRPYHPGGRFSDVSTEVAVLCHT